MLAELQHEWIPYTPEELIQIAEKEFAWCETEVKKAAEEMGCQDWKEALEKVGKADKVAVAEAIHSMEFKTGPAADAFPGTVKFDADGRQDDDWNSGVRISWEGFRRLTLALSATYMKRDSDDDTSDYDEWQGVFSIGYRLIGPRTVGAPSGR